MHLRRSGTLLSLALLLVVSSLGWVASAGAAPRDTAGKTFTTELTGEAEVNLAGVPNQGDLDGTGTARVTLNPGQETICFELSVEDITLPTAAAHIHEAPTTAPGPVVVPLVAPDANGTSSGCKDVDRALVLDILRNPQDYYVNVHTSDFQAGALRGQLG